MSARYVLKNSTRSESAPKEEKENTGREMWKKKVDSCLFIDNAFYSG
jgi:hypothetical protein